MKILENKQELFFKVIRTSYWEKYQLLSYDDVCFYDYLVFLKKEGEIPAIRELAKRLKRAVKTIFNHLNNLENCELIEVNKLLHTQGSRNDYVFRPPYFERRFYSQYKIENPFPKVFLEDVIDRFRNNLAINKAKQRHQNPEKFAETEGQEVEMLDKYDFSNGIQGKYVSRIAQRNDVIILESDIAKVFTNSESVNQALRGLLPIIQKRAEEIHQQ